MWSSPPRFCGASDVTAYKADVLLPGAVRQAAAGKCQQAVLADAGRPHHIDQQAGILRH